MLSSEWTATRAPAAAERARDALHSGTSPRLRPPLVSGLRSDGREPPSPSSLVRFSASVRWAFTRAKLGAAPNPLGADGAGRAWARGPLPAAVRLPGRRRARVAIGPSDLLGWPGRAVRQTAFARDRFGACSLAHRRSPVPTVAARGGLPPPWRPPCLSALGLRRPAAASLRRTGRDGARSGGRRARGARWASA